MVLPELTNEKRREGSKKASLLRSERAAIKEKLKKGELSYFDLESLDQEVIGGMRIADILRALPAVGEVKAAKILKEANISPRKTFSGLGKRQRLLLDEIVGELLRKRRERRYAEALEKSLTGKVVVISGPSGVGKTTLIKRFLEGRSDFFFSVSVTTRKKRKDEVDGRDYIFVNEEEFEKMVRRGLFLEHAIVHGRRYGTPAEPVYKALMCGKNVIFDVDEQGAFSVVDKLRKALLVYIAPPSLDELRRRMSARHEDEESEEVRLKNAVEQIKKARDYDYVIVNRDLEEASNELKDVIEEYLRRDREFV